MRYVTARNAQLPAVGFGTYKLTGPACVAAVQDALEIGYRHLDTAEMYGNEVEVGEGLRTSGIARDEVWLTTKVWRDNLAPERARRAAEASLKKLGVDYVDLLLIHWPNQRVPLFRTLDAFMKLQDEGKTRFIGVSNFPPSLLKQALSDGPVICNQVEYHPFLAQDELLGMARASGIALTAYRPIREAAGNETLQDIGAAHGKSAVQVALRWLIEQEQVAAIPKAASPSHRRANFDVFDFSLTEEDRERINALAKDRRQVDPAWAPEWE